MDSANTEAGRIGAGGRDIFGFSGRDSGREAGCVAADWSYGEHPEESNRGAESPSSSSLGKHDNINWPRVVGSRGYDGQSYRIESLVY